MTASVGSPTAGWYADPNQAGQQRYWDGSAWTQHTAAAPPPEPAPSVPAPSAAPAATFVARTPHAGTNGKAIASLVLSLVWMMGLGSLAAVVLGVIARRETRQSRQPGEGLALAGIIIGALGLVLSATFVMAVAVPTLVAQQDLAQEAALQSDVRNAAIEFENFYTDFGHYPGSVLESGFRPASADQFHSYLSSDGQAYCIEGSLAGTWWSYASTGMGLQQGRC